MWTRSETLKKDWVKIDMYSQSDQRITKQLHTKIENELIKVGLLCRVFSRAKSQDSIEIKIRKSPGKYSEAGKKIQDLFGLRVILYFQDDSNIAQRAIKNLFDFDEASSMVDVPSTDTFSAMRCNFIFRLPEEFAGESDTLGSNSMIDDTFEVQFRTILSEGWHEVEHDLRYKCRDDWESHDDLSRTLNGIYASLETADWSMLQLFEKLAYEHYKAEEWRQMIRTKFRLRSEASISPEVERLICENVGLGKDLYRVDRYKFMIKLLDDKMPFPINMDNIVYLCNHYYLKSDDIFAVTPDPIKYWFGELSQD